MTPQELQVLRDTRREAVLSTNKEWSQLERSIDDMMVKSVRLELKLLVEDEEFLEISYALERARTNELWQGSPR